MIKNLPEDKEEIVLQLSIMYDKLVLTGSLSLGLVGVMDYREESDIDKDEGQIERPTRRKHIEPKTETPK